MSEATTPLALEALGERAPRYTSYPAAPHFSAIDPGAPLAWLDATAQDDDTLSIYLHVPFCKQLCWFCGCNTSVANRYGPVDRFVDNLLGEIEFVGARLNAQRSGRRMRVSHIHFGGGSPTMLREIDFAAIMAALRAEFRLLPDAEIAVEIDPRTLTRGKILAMAREGVNRASLGVQDFDPSVQSAINRIQPFEDIKTAIDDLRAAGIAAINMDLMYGLPLQTIASVQETARLAITLNPDRVSLFPYAHVPWMKKHQTMMEKNALPDVHERYQMEQVMSEAFMDAGMVRIGMDHYAHADDAMVQALDDKALKRNFQGYSTDPADALIAFGPSAISRLRQGYMQNAPDTKTWNEAVEQGRPAWVRGHALSADDALFGDVISQLLCSYEVDLAEVAARHDQPVTRFHGAMTSAKMLELMENGLATRRGSKLFANRDLPMSVRPIAACFDQYLEETQATPRYSKVV